ncbi:BMP family ABC transporter substrate-binding protein [Alkanindiges illinoisensis]|uniref:BMP family ABC transporter substrate-binding protein n=1 Tax=Alkanindiges illinoisensis TaxID=197183 RepID=UPI000685718F|nr:BMP family ABC transporter substrate-binding protein [Alkanindiges illinoisensis]
MFQHPYKTKPATVFAFNQFKKGAIALLTGSLLSLGLMTPASAADPIKAAFIYIGPTGDHGWTYSHNQGRLAVESKLKGAVKTSYIENVPETADAERVMRNLAQQGNKVVFATSFGYMNQMAKVAKIYPNTIFMHATGYKTGKNMGTYDVHTYEGAYMLGVIAGKTTKTNKIGVVASFPIPEVVRNINAYTLGARSVNPKVTTQVIWVNSWFDPGKERDAALALISQGSDTLMQNTDSPAVVQAAEQKGVHAFGWDSNMNKFGPKAQLAASVIHWETIYTKVLSDVLNKTWKPGQIWWGVSHGAIDIENFGPDITPEAKSAVLAVRENIRTGKFHPFSGPIADQSGKVIVAKGKVFSDAELSKMNFYVQGVTGSLPK